MKDIYKSNKQDVLKLNWDQFSKLVDYTRDMKVYYSGEDNSLRFVETDHGETLTKKEAYEKIAQELGVYSVTEITKIDVFVYIIYSEFAPSATDACETLFRSINSSGFSKKEFLSAFNKEHRYLQGEAFSLAKNIIKNCASNDYLTDGRNEWCQRQAKNIVNNNPEEFY